MLATKMSGRRMLYKEQKFRLKLKARRTGFRFSQRIKRLAGKVTLSGVIVSALLIALTAISMRIAYMQRGYFAVGGEGLIIPLAVLIYTTWKMALEERKEKYRNENEDGQ